MLESVKLWFSQRFDAVIRHLPAYMAGGGVLLWGGPEVLVATGMVSKGWIEATIGKFGEIILTGGIFAAVIKSHQFLTIFSETLKKIVTSGDYIRAVRDMGIQDAWKDLAADAYRGKLDRVADEMRKSLPSRIPLDKDWYYERHYLRVFAKWTNATKSAIELRMHLTANIVMASTEALFPYMVDISVPNGAPLDWVIESLDINGSRFVEGGNITDQGAAHLKQFGTPDGTMRTYELDPPLRGHLGHTIERVARATVDMERDPFYTFEAKNYCTYLELRTFLLEPDMGMLFRQIGTSDNFGHFEPPNEAGQPATNKLGRKYSSLIYPGQGYMLLFQRVGRTPEA